MDALPVSHIDLKGLEIDSYKTSISGAAYIGAGAILDLKTGRAYVVKQSIVDMPYVGYNYIYYDISREQYEVSDKLLQNLVSRKLLFMIEKNENGSTEQIINATDITNRDLTLPNVADQVYSTDTEYNLKIEGDKIYVKNHDIKRVEELYIQNFGVVLSKSILSCQGKTIILDGTEMDGRLCDVSYFW